MNPQQTALDIDLPVGYSARPLTLADAEAVAALIEIETRAYGLERTEDPDNLRAGWQTPNFDLEESSLGILDPDERLVATVTVRDHRNPPVNPWLGLSILPDQLQTQVPAAIVAWGIQRAHQAIDRCPPNARVVLGAGCLDANAAKKRTFVAAGMTQTRHFLRMRIDMDAPPPPPEWPEGFGVRTYRHPDELEALAVADREGFRDHYGFVEQDFDSMIRDWQYWLSTDKKFDPTLFFLAIEQATGEIAGISLCRIEQEDDPSVAYVDSLAVLRQYRKRGLALALLHHTFAEFYRRGRQAVALHVDAQSLTGAVRLYEKAGMHTDEIYTEFELELRPGEDLMTIEAGG